MKIINLVLNDFVDDCRVLKTTRSLSSLGFYIRVVALHSGNLKEYENISGVNVHRIIIKSKSWSNKRLVQLIKYFEYLVKFILKYKNADILHCNDLNALSMEAFCRLFNKKLKIVYDSHEYTVKDIPYSKTT